MNKRQIKKRVKQAKLKKENGRIMNLEDQHYMRNYGKYYYTKKEMAFVIENWDEFTTAIKGIVQGVSNAFADVFQGWADALRRNGGSENENKAFIRYYSPPPCGPDWTNDDLEAYCGNCDENLMDGFERWSNCPFCGKELYSDDGEGHEEKGWL